MDGITTCLLCKKSGKMRFWSFGREGSWQRKRTGTTEGLNLYFLWITWKWKVEVVLPKQRCVVTCLRESARSFDMEESISLRHLI